MIKTFSIWATTALTFGRNVLTYITYAARIAPRSPGGHPKRKGFIGIGTDLVSIDRVAAVLDRHGERFIRRVFDEEEQYVVAPALGSAQSARPEGKLRAGAPRGLGDPGFRRDDTLVTAAHYAKRWAAKEAVAKALGVGIDQGVYLRDIVIKRGLNGAPVVHLRGGAAAALQRKCHPGEGRDLQTSGDCGLHSNDTVCVHLSLSDDAGLALAFVVIEV